MATQDAACLRERLCREKGALAHLNPCPTGDPSVSSAHMSMYLDSGLVLGLKFVAFENTLLSETFRVLMHFRYAWHRMETFVPGSVACSQREGKTIKSE